MEKTNITILDKKYGYDGPCFAMSKDWIDLATLSREATLEYLNLSGYLESITKSDDVIAVASAYVNTSNCTSDFLE